MARARHGSEYADRAAAGRALADALRGYRGRTDVVVFGLPRGGVPVAAQVAGALDAPLDVLVVRKLGLPSQPELAMGAIAGVGDSIELARNEQVLGHARVSAEEFDRVYREELAELRRRAASYRGERPGASIRGRTVILVDDGLATGSTMRSAIRAVRRQQSGRLVVAVPVAAASTCAALRGEVDELVCPWTPEPFFAVGQAYQNFCSTRDEDVRRILDEAAQVGRAPRRRV